MDDRPNVLVICVDCLRRDFVASDRTRTPFLDSLRADGLDCAEMYSSTTTTTPSVASLLTGTYAERNGVESLRRARLADDVEPLAAVFGREGWHTEAMVTGPLVPDTGLDRGFDEYRYREPADSAFGEWRETAVDRVESLPEPFAAYVHLWELHEDVSVPAAYDSPKYGDTAYGRALSALDQALRALVEATPENTVVAVHGDHGESVTHRHNPLRLGAKVVRDALKYYAGVDTRSAVRWLNRACDRFESEFSDHFLENGHGENVFDYATNVPFVLAGPGVGSATVDAQCRQVDVFPTLLDAAGVPFDGDVDGETLLPAETVEDRPAYVRACGASLHGERNWMRAVRYDGAKYVEYPNRDWDAEIYDLERDPRELATVDDERLRARLHRRLPSIDSAADQVPALDIDDRLRDLGYL